jgi:hypothetical protein
MCSEGSAFADTLARLVRLCVRDFPEIPGCYALVRDVAAQFPKMETGFP